LTAPALFSGDDGIIEAVGLVGDTLLVALGLDVFSWVKEACLCGADGTDTSLLPLHHGKLTIKWLEGGWYRFSQFFWYVLYDFLCRYPDAPFFFDRRIVHFIQKFYGAVLRGL
jgi:hypothetical protein